MDCPDQLNKEGLDISIGHLDNPRCTTCEDIFDIWTDHLFQGASKISPRYIDIQGQTILAAEKHACDGCRIVLDSLRAVIKTMYPTRIDDLIAQGTVYISLEHTFAVEPHQWHATTRLGKGRFAANLAIEMIGEISASDDITLLEQPARPFGSSISGYTGSDQAVAQAKLWLTKCLEDHGACNQTTKTKLPSRVLWIKGPEDVVLYESAESEVGIYASLSHCWGGQSVMQTTAATLEQLKVHIHWAQLPLTFQEAISFTYRLGIRYLWIDSLCIIQDSQEDWRHESSKMSGVYEDSRLTLAATIAPNASAGLFRTSRSGSRFGRLSYKSARGHVCSVYCRKELSHSWFDGDQESVLMKRAWAFQERLLSPRILHFMHEELWFECSEGFMCECSRKEFEHSPPLRYPGLDYPVVSRKKPDVDTLLRNCHELQEFHWNWLNIAMEYSARVRNLTCSSDVFPALQGLAKLAPPSAGSYLAGHWEKFLEHSLDWFVFGLKSSPRPVQWRAPSWSWASVDERVHWLDRYLGAKEAFCTVVSSNTVPAGLDPTGQLKSGTMIVRSECLIGTLVYSDQNDKDLSPGIVFKGRYIYLDTRDEALSYVFWDYDIRQSGSHSVPDGSTVLAMRLGRLLDGRCQHRTWMVLRLLNNEERVYERIGLLMPDFRSDQSSEEGDMLDAMHRENPTEVELTIC